jgi:hypothetical protein
MGGGADGQEARAPHPSSSRVMGNDTRGAGHDGSRGGFLSACPESPAEPAGDRDARAGILRRELRSDCGWRRVMALKRDCGRPRLSSETGHDERVQP